MTFDKVKDIIVRQLEIDPGSITLDTSFVDDLDADSLEVVELVVAFEDAFDIEIAEDAIENIKTVKDVVNYIDNL